MEEQGQTKKKKRTSPSGACQKRNGTKTRALGPWVVRGEFGTVFCSVLATSFLLRGDY